MTGGTWKRCTVCEEWKPRSEFYARPRQPGEVRAACKYCMKRKQLGVDARHKSDLAEAERRAHMARLVYCPPDEELGIRLYDVGTLFDREEFAATLADGYWPTGSRWQLVSAKELLPAVWEVRGRECYQVDGDRVMR